MGRTIRVCQLGLVSLGLFALSGSVGCQPDATTSSSSTAGTGGGAGGTGGATGGTGGNATGGTSAGGTGGTSAGGTGGTPDTCVDGAESATIYDFTKGNVGQNIKVKIDGVVAMGKKRLISYSSANASCLWGVFVSAPKTDEASPQQLLETAPNSGALVLSTGNLGIANKAACFTDPNAGGDAIPDDVKPGDVLDVVAYTDSFLLDFLPPDKDPCGTYPTDTDIPTLQLSDACQVKKNGTAPVPAPHVFSAGEIAGLAAQHKGDADAEAFHNSWGNVKIRVEDWSPALWPASGNYPIQVAGPKGIVKIAPSEAQIHDNFYYVQFSDAVCEVAPKFADTAIKFNFVQGFHYLDYCTWAISNEDKCADFSPQSDDCTGIASCL